MTHWLPKVVPIVRISEDERREYLESGGIRGSELTRDDLPTEKQEYDRCIAQIVGTIERYGKNGFFADCPYYIDKYVSANYFPCIEVKSEEHVSIPLLIELHHCIDRSPEKYRLDLCSAYLYWNEQFNVFIEHDVLYWCTDDLTATRVGLAKLQSIPRA